MTNNICRYFPAFCEGFKSETVAFNTLEELMALPFVAAYRSAPTFSRFSIAGNALVVEYSQGKEWGVVGLLENPVAGLPNWERNPELK